MGEFPPGRQGRFFHAARVTSNLCLSHTAAYGVIHSLQEEANVGWAQHFIVFKPRLDSIADRWLSSFADQRFNGNFADSILMGRAPFPFDKLGQTLPEVKDTYDYIGINYYSRLRVGWAFGSPNTLFLRFEVQAHKPQGDSAVEVLYGEPYPKGLRRAARRFAAFRKPIYILENGVPDRTDRIRPWWLKAEVKQMRKLLSEGIDLRGYFHWSLTDNFEWNQGWHLRFGLIEVDPVTQRRESRASAQVYADIIRESRNALG